MLIKINEVKTYTFSEFKEIQDNRKLIDIYTKEDLNIAERVLDHVKKNKKLYIKLVFITAMLLHHNSFVFAEDIGASLDATFGELITLLKFVAKWGCLGMGLKRLIEEMLAGGNFKQASTAGVQYWLCYLFIQFYPKLFDMIKL
ncbi:MAG: hypothetical protein RR942_18355 [Romboutsia sp.]